jgi:DNA-binding Lrp family transcriptional regulator
MSNISTIQTATILPTYLYATVEKQELDSILSKLQEAAYVNWFGSTSGRFDLVVTFKGNDMKKTDAAIKEIRSIKGVISTDAVVPFEGRSDANADDQRAMGQVFLSVDRPTEEVIRALKNVVGVTEALAISGQWEVPTGNAYRSRSSQQWHPWEVLVTVRGQNYEEILAKAVHEISQINGVRNSETMFVYKPTVVAA